MRQQTIQRAIPWLCLAGLCGPARAQYIDTYLPIAIPGFGQERGVTVQSRLRPLYQDQGVQLGGFTFRGGIDERFGYDSNITGTRNGPGSSFFQTSPSVSADSNWSRNRLGIAASADRLDYLSAPQQSHTDWTVAVGGGWSILRDMLDVGYSHIHANEFALDSGAVAFDRPVPYDVDVVRSSYTWQQGRVTLTPNVDFRLYQYGNTEIANQSVSERFRDRTVISGGVTTRYLLSDQRSLVFVAQGAASNYLHPTVGAPSNNSQSVLLLPGIDYQASGPWRYRLLFGAEFRNYDAAQFGSRVAPIFEASAIYMPTELTTLTATLRRDIEDPQAEGTSGYTFTGLSLRVDHESRRNVLLDAEGEFRAIHYFQGLGSSQAYVFGGGATWLIDEHLSAFATYRFTRQDGSSQSVASLSGQQAGNVLPSFTQNLALIGLRWKL